MPFDRPTVDDFKGYFVRDFPYAQEDAGPQGGDNQGLDFVIDADINKGLNRSAMMINEGLFGDQLTYTECYLLLSAHNMVMSLRVAAQGVASQPEWLRVGKAAGPVSESQQIPEYILKNPLLSMYQRTGYGQEYLELIVPLMTGAMFTVCGRTQP